MFELFVIPLPKFALALIVRVSIFESFVIPFVILESTFRESIVWLLVIPAIVSFTFKVCMLPELVILPLILPVLKVLIVEPFWLFRLPLIIPALSIVPVALLANKILIPLFVAVNVLLPAISKALVMLPVPI